MQAFSVALTLLSLCENTFARPAPVEPAPAAPAITPPPSLVDRSLVSDLEGVVDDVLGLAVSDIGAIFSSVGAGKLDSNSAWSSVKAALTTVTATTTQTNAASCISALSSIHSAKPSANIYEFVASVVEEGLSSDSIPDLLNGLTGTLSGQNSMANINSKTPLSVIYPKKGSDPRYSVLEATLRAAIYIPPSFQYRSGTKKPVVLVPGTGNTGYYTFSGNFIPLLTGSSWADPVWLNIPGFLLNDAQTNAEYVAYAINYINGITGKKVNVIGWSQGNINTQWAFKYFSSTRSVTSNHIAISPDYAGTENANLICPDGIACDPSVLQQQYMSTSNFITTLRNNNGDSAYVPTTVLYSGLFDEIVEPQQGTGVSAYLNDARNVGVTNNEAQTICPRLPAGSFYSHEGMLYNPLSFALAQDAIVNGGPGKTSRVDLTTLCNEYLTSGLNVGDLLLTENAIVIAGLALIDYTPKVTVEPAIKSYAS